MKKLIFNIVLFLVLMNASACLGCHVAGKPFVFNFIFDIVTPVLCAAAAWTVEQYQSRRPA